MGWVWTGWQFRLVMFTWYGVDLIVELWTWEIGANLLLSRSCFFVLPWGVYYCMECSTRYEVDYCVQ